jgi:hypothetical protein
MARNLLDDSEIKMAIPKSNVLIYYTDGQKFVRDQAERSQKKFYISVNTILDDVEDFKEVEAVLDQKLKNIITAMQLT